MCSPTAPRDCIVPGIEGGSTLGDLRGTYFSGGAATPDTSGTKIADSRVDVFRGTVEGCGTGTVVLFGTELLNPITRGTGEWRVAEGFGTGDLVRMTGHGTGKGFLDAQGIHSTFKGVIDCHGTAGSTPTTTAPATGTTIRWHAKAVPALGAQQCDATHECIGPGTENSTLAGDLQGTVFTGSTNALDTSRTRYAVGETDVFRGSVKGCGSGTLVMFVTILADAKGGTGEWRVVDGFGTGDLQHASGHGTGRGAGLSSEWHGAIDCGK